MENKENNWPPILEKCVSTHCKVKQVTRLLKDFGNFSFSSYKKQNRFFIKCKKHDYELPSYIFYKKKCVFFTKQYWGGKFLANQIKNKLNQKVWKKQNFFSSVFGYE